MSAFVRILADDLTGALDCAACFTGDIGPMPVHWKLPDSQAGSFALSSETRELAREDAIDRVAQATRAIRSEQSRVVLKKVDSLLRGHVAAEIATMMQVGGFGCAVFAPAFPERGRITRQGLQYARTDAGVEAIATDVGAELRALGVTTCADAAGLDGAGPVVWIADAESDAELQEVVRRAGPHPVLWCGTAGLASALASAPPPATAAPSGRTLVVSGSDHPVALAQAAAIAEASPDAVIRLAPDESAAGRVDRVLRERGVVVVTVDLPSGSRAVARGIIGRTLERLLPAMTPPDVLVVMGGETLRQCCDALAAEGLIVDGLVEPGIPRARFLKGAWAGTRIMSKSGAFGDAGTLLRILGLGRHHISAEARSRVSTTSF